MVSIKNWGRSPAAGLLLETELFLQMDKGRHLQRIAFLGTGSTAFMTRLRRNCGISAPIGINAAPKLLLRLCECL